MTSDYVPVVASSADREQGALNMDLNQTIFGNGLLFRRFHLSTSLMISQLPNNKLFSLIIEWLQLKSNFFQRVRGSFRRVRGSFPFVRGSVSFVRGSFSVVRGSFPFVRGYLPFVRDSLQFVRDPSILLSYRFI